MYEFASSKCSIFRAFENRVNQDSLRLFFDSRKPNLQHRFEAVLKTYDFSERLNDFSLLFDDANFRVVQEKHLILKLLIHESWQLRYQSELAVKVKYWKKTCVVIIWSL